MAIIKQSETFLKRFGPLDPRVAIKVKGHVGLITHHASRRRCLTGHPGLCSDVSAKLP